MEKLDRSWKNIFINSKGNLTHAYNSLLQQLENDKEEVTEIDKDNLVNSASYQLTKNLVLSKITPTKDKELFFQFKLTSTMQGSPNNSQDILISIIHESK